MLHILFFKYMAEYRYKQLTKSDMIKIETLIQEGYSNSEIGIKIGKDRTTIYRCIKKCNKIREEFSYEEAWEEVSQRKTESNKQYRIVDESVLSKYILIKIELSWSPEQIAGKWREATGESLCKDTIYKWVYENHPKLIKLHFRRKGKKYVHHRKQKYQIKDRRMIDERPESVENRLEVGHWEGDTIVGKNHKGAIITNVERKTGFLIATKIETGNSNLLADATIKDFKNIPDSLSVSITYDNGKEFSKHKRIEKETAMTVYFAHPYTPWERGSNENTNGLLREFIPKGTSFKNITQEDLQRYVDLINNRPRKRLKFLTPSEAFDLEISRCSFG